MPIQISCPSCGRALRVPDTLLGQNVKCPSCEATFDAAIAGPPSDAIRDPVAAPVRRRDDDEPAARPRPRFDDRYDDDDDDDDFEYRRRRGAYRSAHRGGAVLTLGILSIVAPLVCFLGGFMGIAAWTMGLNDLRAMREGRMDPDGRGMTKAGMILGIIGTVLVFFWILVLVLVIAADA
jgi:hypothetical protein